MGVGKWVDRFISPTPHSAFYRYSWVVVSDDGAHMASGMERSKDACRRQIVRVLGEARRQGIKVTPEGRKRTEVGS